MKNEKFKNHLQELQGFMDKDETKKKKGHRSGKVHINIFLWFPLLILCAGMLYNSFYTVSETETGVVQTFGKYTSSVGPGLHLKFPWPIQKVTKVVSNRTHKMEFGYYQDEQGLYHSEEKDDSIMITGDMNVVDIDFFLEYKISDPVKYLFNSNKPESVLKYMLMSSARSVVGTKSIDETLTTGKFKIQAEVKEMLTSKLAENDIGISVVDVKVNDSEPPNDTVTKAFRDVETAKQEKDTMINKANEYRNGRLPQAKGQADQIIKQAESYAAGRINEAKGLKEKYESMYRAYAAFPGITRERMYLEAITDILPNITLIIDDSEEGGIKKYLPIEKKLSSPEALLEGETSKKAAGDKGDE